MTKKLTGTKMCAAVIILTVLLFAVQYLSSRVGWLAADLFDFSAIDKDGLFAAVAVHHAVQLSCALAVIMVLHKFGIKGFGLRPAYNAEGVRYTLIFCLVLLAYYIATYIIGGYLHSINTYDYELTPVNVAGTLGFQLFLSGPSEEVLFRSLPITLMLYFMDPDDKKHRITAVVIAAFLFGLGHINLITFSVPWFQVCYAFVLGLAYGFVLLKTNSVIYPMIMHSMSNVISVGGCYLYMLQVK